MISVLITNYNTRGLLNHCLERLRAQEGTWGEVIVIDNGSADGSAEMVEREFPWCRLLRLSKNVGFGTANNQASAMARGDRLLLLNSDAWLTDGALHRLEEALDEETRTALVAPQLHYPDGRLQFTWVPTTGVVGEAVQIVRNRFEPAAWNHTWVPRLLRALLGPGWYTAACLLVERRVFEELGGFDENIFLYFEDVDLCYRMARAGWRLRSVPDAKVFHIKGGSATDFSEVAYREAQLYYYSKHRPAWEQRVLRRRLSRKFERVERAELRRRLQALLDESGLLGRAPRSA